MPQDAVGSCFRQGRRPECFAVKSQKVKPKAQTDWLVSLRAAHNVCKVNIVRLFLQ